MAEMPDMSRCVASISWKRGQGAEFFILHSFWAAYIALVMKKALFVVLSCAALALPVQARKPEPHIWPELGVEAQIVFPNHGAIRNFEADGNDGIWLEDQQRRWYYAEMFGPCQGLNFAQRIGFDTNGSANFDKFSSIIVDRQNCRLTSLVTAEKPLPLKERVNLRNEAREAGKKAVAPAN
ncbi:MAG: DUF6491 family protein [Sphingorhabdus sp.]